VKGVLTRDTLARLTRGVELDDGPARAKRAELLEHGAKDSRLKLVLIEGRKREVRRLLTAVGHPVLRLMRVRFGPIALGTLARGTWRTLSEDERRLLVERSRQR
jgi:pseudouridine synthase